TISAFKAISGGRIGNNAIFIELWCQVRNSLPLNIEGGVLENTAQISIIRGTQVHDHNYPHLHLHDSCELSILEPYIRDDASLSKSSEPASLPPSHEGPVLDLRDKPTGDNPIKYVFSAKNTGTSPAYEIRFEDQFPWQLEDPGLLSGALKLEVKISPDAGVPRSLLKGSDYSVSWTQGVYPDNSDLQIQLLDSVDAALGVNETLEISYQGKIATVAPGTYIDNSARIAAYSSLPGVGALLSSSRGSSLAEGDEERLSYADSYRPLPAKATYHKFTEELINSALLKAEITYNSNDTPPELRDDGSTRATIGEVIEYQVRLSLPRLITLHDLAMAIDVPDGISVRSAKWAQVTLNAGFSGAEQNLTLNLLPSGITELRGQAGTGGDDFPQPLVNNSGVDQELLIIVRGTVNNAYTSGDAVKAGDSFNLPVQFTWSTGSDARSPGPQFRIVEPELEELSKEQAAVNPDSFGPLLDGYRNYNDVGPSPSNSGAVNQVAQTYPGQIVEYSVSIKNSGDAIAYDLDLADLIPAGMSYVAGSASISAAPKPSAIAFRNVPSAPVAPDRSLLFELNQLEPGNTATLKYRLQVDVPVAAGRFLLNQVRLADYSTLPESGVDYPEADRHTELAQHAYDKLGPEMTWLGTAFPTVSKTVESEFTLPAGKLADGSSRATIGEVMTYELLVDIPDDTVLYDFYIEDLIPANLSVQMQDLTPANLTYALVKGNTYDLNSTELSVVGNQLGLYIPGALSADTGISNEIQLLIAVTVDDHVDNKSGSVFKNNMTLSWNQEAQGAATPGARNRLSSIVTPDPAASPNTVDFTIVEPEFVANSLTKTRSGHFLANGTTAASSPGTASYRNYNADGPDSHSSVTDPVNNVYQIRPTEIVEFSVTFTNSGDGRAYDILLEDLLPPGFELLSTAPNAPSISANRSAGIAFINATPAQTGGAGTPISFALNYLDAGDTATLRFRTRLLPGAAAGAYMQNKLSLLDYGSSPDDSAIFPDLERDSQSVALPYGLPHPKYEKLGTVYPTTSKTVESELSAPAGKNKDGSSRATIGELITYEILLDLEDDLLLYDLRFEDIVPDGLEVQSANYSYKGSAAKSLDLSLNANGTTTLKADTNPFNDDIVAEPSMINELVITITATVRQSFVSGSAATDGGVTGIVDVGDILRNNASFTWNQINDQPTASSQNAEPEAVAFTVIEPNLDNSFAKIIKRVLDSDGSSEVSSLRGHTGTVSEGLAPAASGGKASYFDYSGGAGPLHIEDVQVVLPDDIVEYEFTMKNQGNAYAFDIKVSDLLPPDATVSYLSGTGDFNVGSTPFSNGSANSILSIASSPDTVGGVSHTRLDFGIDFLAPGDSATINYRLRVKQGLGAGHYIGDNVAELLDYSSLPASSFAVDIGNLAAGNTVYDHDLERNCASTPAYAQQGPLGEDIGLQYPEFSVNVYRVYDVEGQPVNELLSDSSRVRVGEVLLYELVATLPRHTRLFDGGAQGFAYRHRLNPGYHLIANSEDYNAGDLALSGLLQSGSPSLTASAGQQYPTWYFDDLYNSSSSAQSAVLRFQAEVKNSDYNHSAYFVDQTALYPATAHSYLFWNTEDLNQRQSLDHSNTLNSGDHPFLLRQHQETVLAQPNLELSKHSNPEPDSIIGASDTVTYTLLLRNWDSSSAADYQGGNTCYEIELSDRLPRDIAPVSPDEPLLSAAIYSLNGAGQPGSLLRSLTRNTHYVYNYLYDSVTRRGSISFSTMADGNSFAARIEANQALLISYQVTVNPEIGARGSGTGQRVNLANLEQYYSFPEGVNDDSRKEYGPEGPRRVSLRTDVPAILKSSDTADKSLLPGGIVEYKLLAPASEINANLYDVLIRDELPDGLSFGGSGTVSGSGPGPVTLELGDGPGQVPGFEVEVTGGSGTISIAIVDRMLVIEIEQIEPEQQVEVSLRAIVGSTFDNGNPINRLYEFVNTANLLWWDTQDDFEERNRYVSLSPPVSHFFDARGILFEPSHSGTAQPGTIRSYRHVLRNFEENDIQVPINFSNTQEKWVWQLFVGDGEGNMVSGPYDSGTLVSVPAQDWTEVIMRVFVPEEITAFTTDVLNITATGAVDNIISVSDVTVVQAERIAVFKEIKTDGDYLTRLQVQPEPGNAVTQRIRFYNNGPEDVKEVYIYDFIPEHTAYVANSAVDDAEFALQYSLDGGVSWLPGEPPAPDLNKVSNLRWYYNAGGILKPGDEKTITFQIRIK
ncbi:MAG: DUF11 domain-containing protein, partial [Lentisphaeria bacterium]|nr:DUF11 domain-containing protein [Lentisphaeria bacterium]